MGTELTSGKLTPWEPARCATGSLFLKRRTITL